MSCHELNDLLYPFVDGELSVEQNVSLLKHVELCPPCAARVARERDLRGLVERAAQHERPAHLVDVRPVVSVVLAEGDTGGHVEQVADGHAFIGRSGEFGHVGRHRVVERGDLAVGKYGSTIYVMTGYYQVSSFQKIDYASMDAYATATSTWTTMPPMPSSDLGCRDGRRAGVVGSSLYFLGGNDGPNYCATMFEYKIATAAWSVQPPM